MSAGVKARNPSLDFLSHRPLWVWASRLVPAHCPQHTGPGGELAAVQGAGAPEAAGWAMACPLGNPGPLSTQLPNTPQHKALAVIREMDGATSPSLPHVAWPHHTTLHVRGSREEKEENTREPDSQDAPSPGPEFLT